MVSTDIASGLRRRGVSVLTTHDAGNLANSDEEQLDFAKQNELVIFTMDDDYLLLHHKNPEHTGIIYAAQNKKISVGEAVKSLWLLYEVLTPRDMQGHVEYL